MTPQLKHLMDEAREGEKNKIFLSAQRFRQFASTDPTVGIIKNNFKAYNCSSSYMDRPEVFGELMYVLLNGVGAGISVQKHHTKGLPPISVPIPEVEVFVIPDTIEGWAEAVQKLMDSYFYDENTVLFDYSQIRPAGSEIAGQFLAPGPDGLERAIENIRTLVSNAISEGHTRLRPIHVYDIAMYTGEAVLSGGIRRSALLVMFDVFDTEMMNAKMVGYYTDNPQRAMSNNSAVIIRYKANKESFDKIIESVKNVGEPGFAFIDHKDIVFNPCFEVGMWPKFKLGATDGKFKSG